MNNQFNPYLNKIIDVKNNNIINKNKVFDFIIM